MCWLSRCASLWLDDASSVAAEPWRSAPPIWPLGIRCYGTCAAHMPCPATAPTSRCQICWCH